MAITIRELLASDTISGATDKINFNFDQLLLNGGGPSGPPGIQGPSGPIGGRGIRGSIWYEDVSLIGPGNSPNTVPPTLTPEDEDNYLQFNGIVWTYVEASLSWVPTGVNLRGPAGPVGSGGFSAYKNAAPYGVAGDTTIYPSEMAFSYNSTNQYVKATVLGGFPEYPGMNPNPYPLGNSVIKTIIAQNIVMPDITLFLHQFDASGRAIVFHGGDVLQNFNQTSVARLSGIGLSLDDTLEITAPKPPTLTTTAPEIHGIRLLTTERSQFFKSGKQILMQTGTSTTGSNFGIPGEFNFEVESTGPVGSSPQIKLSTTGLVPIATLVMGGVNPIPTSTSNTGDFFVEAGSIALIGSGQMNLRTSNAINVVASQNVNIDSTGANVNIDAELNIDVTSTNGSIFNTALNGNFTNIIGGDTSINSAGTQTYTSAGNALLESSTGDVNIDGAIDVNVDAGADVNIYAADNVNIWNKTGDVHIYTGNGSGDDILIDTDNNNAQIKLETFNSSSPVSLIVNHSTSEIVIDANHGGALPGWISQSGTNAYGIVRAEGHMYIGAGTTNYNFPNFLPSGNDLVLQAETDLVIDAINGDIDITADGFNQNITLTHGASGEIRLTNDSTTTTVEIVPGGALSGSYLRVYNDGPATEGIQIESFGTNYYTIRPINMPGTLYLGTPGSEFQNLEVNVLDNVDITSVNDEPVSITGKAQIGQQVGPSTGDTVQVVADGDTNPGSLSTTYNGASVEYDRMMILRTNQYYAKGVTALRLTININAGGQSVASIVLGADGGFNGTYSDGAVYMPFFLPANVTFQVVLIDDTGGGSVWTSGGGNEWRLYLKEQRFGKI